MDLFVTCGDGIPKPNFLYRNNGNGNHWLKVKLTGTASNRSGLRAKVRLNATIRGKNFWQTREISGNSGNGGGANSLLAHFGLGDATKADIVRVEWPSGNVQELTDVSPDQLINITEVVRITPTKPSSSLNGAVTLTNAAVAGATYQWQFKGVDLPGQTSRTLSLTNIQSTQQGDYSTVVMTAAQTVTNHVYLLVDTQFTKITEGPLVTDLASSFTAPAADYDGDGYLDLYVTRFDVPSNVGSNTLYRNNRDGTFATVSNVPFARIGGPGYAVSWGDLDNDGRVDLIAADVGKPAYSNRDAAGSKVRLQAKYAGQVRWQRRDITGGDIFNGQQFYAHFGLGDATNVTTLRIEWPSGSGSVQEFTNVTPNQFLTIWEAPALSAAILPDGACLLTITAEPNHAWSIESSTDLQTWAQLAQVTNPNARFDYTDTKTSGVAYRFYRVTGE